MYGALKFSDLITKPNPYISSYFKDNEMNGKPLNLNEHNFRIAFSVESYLSPFKQKSDSKYVKYIFRMFGKRNGKDFQRVLNYHKCTDEDYAEFYPVKKQSESILEAIKEDPERGMFCFDWKDDDPIEVMGYEFDTDFSRLEVLFVPCNYLHTTLGYQGD